MNYPDNFDVSAFPAGTRVAASRVMAISVAVIFLLIVFVCGILVWSRGSGRIHPFLISTGYNGVGEWSIIGHDHGRRTVSAMYAMQESLVGKYIRSRFTISASGPENESVWSACDRTSDCTTTGNSTTRASCALFCAGTDDVFRKFMEDVVPNYRDRAASGERWGVDTSSIQIRSGGGVNENGGMWRAVFRVVSNMDATMTVVAYVKIARNPREYPATLGFFVADFNAYRVN